MTSSWRLGVLWRRIGSRCQCLLQGKQQMHRGPETVLLVQHTPLHPYTPLLWVRGLVE